MAETASTRGGAAPRPRPGRAVRGRLRQRRLVDLLRARPGRALRARADAGHLHDRRADLRLHRRHLRRGDRALPGGGRLLELRPPRLQRVRLASSPAGRRCSPTSSRSRSRPSSSRTTWPSSGSRSATGPATSSSGSALVALLALLNVKGTEESARLNLVLAIADLADPGRAGRDRAARSSSTPTCSSPRSTSASRPTLGRLRARDRGRDGRLHRDRDDLEHVRGGARRRSRTIPRGTGAGGARGGRPLRASCRRSRSRRCRSTETAGRRVHDRARDHLRRRPGARDRREHRPQRRAHRRAARSTSGCSPR